jgi:hypothetical protein
MPQPPDIENASPVMVEIFMIPSPIPLDPPVTIAVFKSCDQK